MVCIHVPRTLHGFLLIYTGNKRALALKIKPFDENAWVYADIGIFLAEIVTLHYNMYVTATVSG